MSTSIPIAPIGPPVVCVGVYFCFLFWDSITSTLLTLTTVTTFTVISPNNPNTTYNGHDKEPQREFQHGRFRRASGGTQPRRSRSSERSHRSRGRSRSIEVTRTMMMCHYRIRTCRRVNVANLKRTRTPLARTIAPSCSTFSLNRERTRKIGTTTSPTCPARRKARSGKRHPW